MEIKPEDRNMAIEFMRTLSVMDNDSGNFFAVEVNDERLENGRGWGIVGFQYHGRMQPCVYTSRDTADNFIALMKDIRVLGAPIPDMPLRVTEFAPVKKGGG